VGLVHSTRRARSIGDTRINRDGYVLVFRPDYPGARRPHYIQEHRLVMERILGRPMEAHETVHHVNGIRHDNRAENLELWIKPQPNGQRAIDLARWVIQNYPDLIAELAKT
jgi:hypothetical protein